MPEAVLIRLRAAEAGILNGQTGRAVHGLWFEYLPPEDADRIHATTPAPFSISPMMGLPRPERGRTRVERGQLAWFRVTWLDDAHPEALEGWLGALPPLVELAAVRWEVLAWLQAGMHPWAGSKTYAQLAHVGVPSRISVEFITPVSFNSGSTPDGHPIYLPFPLPDSLVRSWLRRWNAFAPEALRIRDDLPEMARQTVGVAAFELKTVPMRYGIRRLHIGCVGTYTLNLSRCPRDLRAQLWALARYAFYCGSGAKTTQGMGMTIPIRADHGEKT